MFLFFFFFASSLLSIGLTYKTRVLDLPWFPGFDVLFTVGRETRHTPSYCWGLFRWPYLLNWCVKIPK